MGLKKTQSGSGFLQNPSRTRTQTQTQLIYIYKLKILKYPHIYIYIYINAIPIFPFHTISRYSISSLPFLLSHSLSLTPYPPSAHISFQQFSSRLTQAHSQHSHTRLTLSSLSISQLTQSHGLHLTHSQAPLPKLSASHRQSKLSAPPVQGLTAVPNCHHQFVLYFSSIFFFLSIS